jgi:hypothetical protein
MASPGWETDYVVPGAKQVRLTLFWGDNYFDTSYRDCIATTRSMLDQHGLKLDLVPGGGGPTDQFRIEVPVKADGLLHEEDYNEVRNRCAAKFDDQAADPHKQRLPIIFCQFKRAAHGLTIPTTPWLPFCLVDAVADEVTMLHEAGHASGLPHLTTSSKVGQPQNFMFDGGGDRSLMHKAQLQVFAKAYFVS